MGTAIILAVLAVGLWIMLGEFDKILTTQ